MTNCTKSFFYGPMLLCALSASFFSHVPNATAQGVSGTATTTITAPTQGQTFQGTRRTRMVYDEIIVGGDPGEGNGFLVEYNAADVTGSSNNNCRFTGVAVGDYKIDCVAKLTHHPTWDTSGQAEPFVIKEESFTVIVGRPNSVVDSVPPVTCSGTSEVYQGSERMNSSCTYRLAAKQTDGSFLVVGSGSDSKSVTFSVSAPWTSAFNPLIPLFHSPLLAFK